MTMNGSNLTTSQLLIWLGLRQHPDAPIYNMAMSFAIHQALDVQVFTRAFQTLVAECDVLRTVFYEHNGIPQRKVMTSLEFGTAVEHIDFTHEVTPDITFNAWLSARCKQRLDLSVQAFDCVLAKLGDSHYMWYFNQHHLIADARSTELIFERVSRYYAEFATGNPNPQEPPPSFEDYAAYAIGCANSTRGAKATAYWKTLIKEAEQLEPAALYGLRSPYSTTNSSRISFDLGPARMTALNALLEDAQIRSLNRDVTLYQVVLTALFAFLYRVSEQKTVFVSAPSSNRTKTAHRNTVGLLMEMFALRVHIDHSESLVSLYEKVRAETLDFFRYAEPGSSSLELIRTAPVMLNFVKVAFPQFAGKAVHTEFVHTGASEPYHQLRVQVRDFTGSGRLIIDFDFNTALSESLRHAATDAFMHLLDAFIDAREQPLAELDLLSATARREIVLDFNATAASYQSEAPLHVRFQAQAQQYPQRIAVSDACNALSYAELEQRSNQLAHELELRGAKPGQHVALQLERSCEFIVALLATLKLGAAYLPIEIDLPSARQHLLLQESSCAAVISTTAFAAKLKALNMTTVVCIDSDWPTISQHLAKPPQRMVELDDLAYILFTSGSTGKPKGVLCNHRGVVNLLEDFEQHCALGALDAGAACSWWTSAGFDVSVYEIFSALAFGRTLHIVPAHLRADSALLYQWLCEQKINSAYLPPFMLEPIAALDAASEQSHVMKRLLVGVEPIAESTLAAFYHHHPDLTIINGYGPTEATICATLHTIPRRGNEVQASTKRVPIGRPVRNNQVYILDKFGHPVPCAAPGELFIGGHGLARGYLGHASLTDERFVANPFSAQSGARLYRTGDRVKLREDGVLEFLGRVDLQMKIRGHRIEPSEIEHALTRHPTVSEATVTVYPNENGDQQLVAYLLATESNTLSTTEWFAWLSSELPTYMIPKLYVTLSSFPRTSSGKIDRSALPEPVFGEEHATTQTVAPRTTTETTLAHIWATVLNLEAVSIHDHFIELGGDSMHALQIAASAHEAGIALTPRQLFDTPTVAELAKIVAAHAASNTPAPTARVAEISAVNADLSAAELEDLFDEYGED